MLGRPKKQVGGNSLKYNILTNSFKSIGSLVMILAILNAIDATLVWLTSGVENHPSLAVLCAGAFVFIVYLAQKSNDRSNAAKLILQEIRYAEQKVQNFKGHGSYNLNEKVLPTNNWNNNISLFVKELGETEIDQISDFYSSAARLDEVLKAVADFRNKQAIESPDGPGTGTIFTTTADLPKTAGDLIKKISEGITTLYNTPATSKLRQFADRKWYQKL